MPIRFHREHSVNSKSLVKKVIHGEACPRIPASPMAVHFCANQFGVSIEEYTTNPKVLADSVIHFYEKFRPDAVWISADTWVSAQAMGAKVGFVDSNQPMGCIGEPVIQTMSDIDRIPPPDINTQGRYPIMLEAMARVAEAIGREVFLAACFDQYPFSLACALMGVEQAMFKIYEDRPMLDAVMERCCEYASAYAQALASAGADLLSGGDSPASLLGKSLYSEVAHPMENKLIEELHQKTDLPISLHICGNATSILEAMSTTGADILEIDQCVSLEEAIKKIPSEIAIWGNLDPVHLLLHQKEEEVARVTEDLLEMVENFGRRRFILSSGCTLATETPSENIHAMLSVPHKHKEREQIGTEVPQRASAKLLSQPQSVKQRDMIHE